MFSAFERLMAFRYLRAKRQEGFISVVAWFSLLGIMLGVATLIIVMSVMNGFRAELLSRILGRSRGRNDVQHDVLGAFLQIVVNRVFIRAGFPVIDGVAKNLPHLAAKGDEQRVITAPPCCGGAMRHIFGTTAFVTSPRFMIGPALRRIDSSLALSSVSASSAAFVS